MTNDPISDMLTRIRNASAVGKAEVLVPYSKMKHGIANLLSNTEYVGKVTKLEKGDEGNISKFPMLRIGLKYEANNKSVIRNIKRISKPGLRVYKSSMELPVVLNHLGIAIVSTSQGLMTNKDARKKGVGGEIICEVY